VRENKFRVYCEIEFEGRITKCMESSASWFLLTQTGKLWSYGVGQIPQPLEKEYKVAIPLFYTGLKDRDGTEIYKGDIVKWQAGYYKAKRNQTVIDSVIFEEGCFKTKKYKMPIAAIPDCEIIGNIYENPELMQEEK